MESQNLRTGVRVLEDDVKVYFVCLPKKSVLFCNAAPIFSFYLYRKDEKEYALKQIEGTGISMSACREIAVSYILLIVYLFLGLQIRQRSTFCEVLSEIEMCLFHVCVMRPEQDWLAQVQMGETVNLALSGVKKYVWSSLNNMSHLISLNYTQTETYKWQIVVLGGITCYFLAQWLCAACWSLDRFGIVPIQRWKTYICAGDCICKPLHRARCWVALFGEWRNCCLSLNGSSTWHPIKLHILFTFFLQARQTYVV